MSSYKTFTIIKPCAVKNGHIGHILGKINDAGFRISALKMIHLRTDEAKAFYAVHKERPFFESLVNFMTSGHIVVAILEKENAVSSLKKKDFNYFFLFRNIFDTRLIRIKNYNSFNFSPLYFFKYFLRFFFLIIY